MRFLRPDTGRCAAWCHPPGLFSGPGAAAPAKGIVTALEAHPELMALIIDIERVVGRRWDLVLAGGMRVKLPPANFQEALVSLGRVAAQNPGIFYEISEMDLGLQAKLLRVIQEKEVERIGGRKVIPLDVRILATTNRDLHRSVADGLFREDLYYRLNVFRIRIPPLHDRPEDIMPLFLNFVSKIDPDIFREALAYSEADKGFTSTLIEKDYYCSLVLQYFFSEDTELVFKKFCLSELQFKYQLLCNYANGKR